MNLTRREHIVLLARIHFSLRAGHRRVPLEHAMGKSYAWLSSGFRWIVLCVLCLGASFQLQAAPTKLTATFPASTTSATTASISENSIFTTGDGRVWQVVSGGFVAGPLSQDVWLYDNGSSLIIVTVLNGLSATVKDISGSNSPADTQLPTIPTGLSATAPSQTSINLSWTISTDNVAVALYRVYRNGTWIGSSATNTYPDTNLAHSTGFSYTVAACDAAGNCSTQSIAVLGTTQSPDVLAPTVPANLTVTTTTTSSVSLTWSASTDNVSVTGYKIYRGDANGGNSAWIASPATASYTDSGLTASTTYSYAVVACDAASNCSARQTNPEYATTKTPANTAATDTLAPTVPNKLAAAATAIDSVALSWTASADNVAVTGYKVYRGDSNGNNSVWIASPTTTAYTDTGLAASTTYSYTVVACDAASNCSAAQPNPELVKTPAPPDTTNPTTPSGLVSSVTNSSVTLIWSKSTDDVAVTSYNIYRDSVKVGSSTTTTFTDESLTPATSYNYRVSACDAANNCSGQSALLTISTLTADTISPTAPVLLSVEAISATQVSVSWTASTDNVAVSAYKVYRAPGSLAGQTGPSVTTFSDTQAVSGTSYNYSVAACDAAGNCASSAPLSITPSADAQAPSIPFFLTASVSGTTVVDLAWLPSTDDVGVSNYKVFRDGQVIGATQVTSYRDTGLVPSTSYIYNIAACDAAGHCSSKSSSLPVLTPQAAVSFQTRADCLFNWAESKYSAHLGPPAESRADGQYYWRYYSGTGAALVVYAGDLYYYGPLSANASLNLGAISTWYATAGCP